MDPSECRNADFIRYLEKIAWVGRNEDGSLRNWFPDHGTTLFYMYEAWKNGVECGRYYNEGR